MNNFIFFVSNSTAKFFLRQLLLTCKPADLRFVFVYSAPPSPTIFFVRIQKIQLRVGIIHVFFCKKYPYVLCHLKRLWVINRFSLQSIFVYFFQFVIRKIRFVLNQVDISSNFNISWTQNSQHFLVAHNLLQFVFVFWILVIFQAKLNNQNSIFVYKQIISTPVAIRNFVLLNYFNFIQNFLRNKQQSFTQQPQRIDPRNYFGRFCLYIIFQCFLLQNLIVQFAVVCTVVGVIQTIQSNLGGCIPNTNHQVSILLQRILQIANMRIRANNLMLFLSSCFSSVDY